MKGVLLQDAALLELGGRQSVPAEGGAEHVQPITGDSVLEAPWMISVTRATPLSPPPAVPPTPLFKATLPRKMVLVLGQERDGLSDAPSSSADMSVSIDGTGNVDRLNVSVATGVLLAEWWRSEQGISLIYRCPGTGISNSTHSLPVTQASSQSAFATLFQPLICQNKMVTAKETAMRQTAATGAVLSVRDGA